MVRIKSGGFAIPLALLLLLALGLLAHGALLLSRRELSATWGFRNLIAADRAAEMGLHLAFQLPVGPAEDQSSWVLNPLVSGGTQDGLSYQAGRRWLDNEFFLLEGIGRVRGWSGDRRLVWLGWMLHPTARMRSFLAAVEVGKGVVREDGSIVSAENMLKPPYGWPDSACREYLPPMGSPLAETVPFSTVEKQTVGGAEKMESTPPGLGLLSGIEMIRRLKKEIELEEGRGSVIPGKVVRPGSFSMPAVHVSEADLDLGENHSFGLIVVVGNLRLSGGARFQGLALVGGSLLLEDQASFEGLAKVGERLHLRGTSSFQASACPVARALWGIPALREPVAISTRPNPG